MEIPEDDLEWLDKFWNFWIGDKRIGQIFCEEMDGFKYKSAQEIIKMLRDKQKEAKNE